LTDARSVTGVQGSREEYYASRNSILHSVLASGRGLPIILCVVHMALGRSVGLPIQPVNMPMHFLTRMGDDGAPDLVFIDAFSGGRILDRHALCTIARGPLTLPWQSLELTLFDGPLCQSTLVTGGDEPIGPSGLSCSVSA